MHLGDMLYFGGMVHFGDMGGVRKNSRRIAGFWQNLHAAVAGRVAGHGHGSKGVKTARPGGWRAEQKSVAEVRLPSRWHKLGLKCRSFDVCEKSVSQGAKTLAE